MSELIRVKSGQEVAAKGSVAPKPLQVEDIPQIIFNDLSENLGVGEMFALHIDGFDFQTRKLNPEHEATGFAGTIGFGFNRHTGHTVFALWPSVPTGEDSVFKPHPTIRLVAGKQRTGMWAAGMGDHMEHRLLADFGLDRPNVKHPAIALTALIILRANQLARDPSIVRESYWWNERYGK